MTEQTTTTPTHDNREKGLDKALQYAAANPGGYTPEGVLATADQFAKYLDSGALPGARSNGR